MYLFNCIIYIYLLLLYISKRRSILYSSAAAAQFYLARKIYSIYAVLSPSLLLLCAIYLSCNGPERSSLSSSSASHFQQRYISFGSFSFSFSGYIALLVYIPFFGFIAAAQLLLLPAEKEGRI